MSIGAILLLTATAGAHGYSVSVTPVADMDECFRVREAVALTFARKDQYEMTSIPNVWKTREGQYNYGRNSVKLECKPV